MITLFVYVFDCVSYYNPVYCIWFVLYNICTICTCCVHMVSFTENDELNRLENSVLENMRLHLKGQIYPSTHPR